jgi:hypothetical protein
MHKDEELKNPHLKRRHRSRGEEFLQSLPITFSYSETPINMAALDAVVFALYTKMIEGRPVHSTGKSPTAALPSDGVKGR